jgi:hypothetical protein
MKTLNHIGYYLLSPLLIVGFIVWFVNDTVHDLEKTVSITNSLIQSIAIVIGGLWAYKKFDWDKRAENALKIKAMLMDYLQMHNLAASQYRMDQIHKIDDMKAWENFAIRMISPRNEFAKQIHLSLYLPKETRNKLFNFTWLSLNKGKGPHEESIDKNWGKIDGEMKEISNELDAIVDN